MNGDEDRKQVYPVGYCRPPLATRFKPGQSGNPTGKRKQGSADAKPSIASDLAKLFNEMIMVTDGGKKRRITKREAFLRSMVHMAIQGKPTAISRLVQIAGEANLIGEATKDGNRGGLIVVSKRSDFKTWQEELEHHQRPHREQKPA